MEFKRQNFKKISHFRSPDFKAGRWLEKRIVWGKYSYSLKNLAATAAGVLASLFILIYFISWYQAIMADPNKAIEREIRFLTLKIGRTMELPSGEQPSLATVSDKNKLKGQDFFSRARNGDKLLIYSKARKAILYRPLEGKIIEVTNLTSGSQKDYPVIPEPNPQVP